MGERKYFVKASWIFNLEAMHDKLMNIIDEVNEGTLSFPLMIAGRECVDEDDITYIDEEALDLQWLAKSGPVTSIEYGKIKELAEWRAYQRYLKCREVDECIH